jgi:all-trans-retinol 13,14-reductase
MRNRRIGTPLKRAAIAPRYDVIVIGSGVGGLMAAKLLARETRKRVLVLERHYTAGGFTHTFHRPGFEWDVGVHYIGDVLDPRAEVRRLFDYLTDGAVQWESLGAVYDRLIFPDRIVDLRAGRDEFRASLLEHFPRCGAAIADISD